MTKLKSIERIRNGGMTDDEEASKREEKVKERKQAVEESLSLVMGKGKLIKKHDDGTAGEHHDEASKMKGEKMEEVVVEEVDDTATADTHSDMSFMTKLRLKEQEIEDKVFPVQLAANEHFGDAIISLTLAEELWVASGKAGSGVGADISTGVEIYYNRGRCNIFCENKSDGIKDFNRVLKLMPFHIPTLVMRGTARMALGQYPQAKRDFAKILNKLDPEHKKAEERKEECEIGIANLTLASICKPDDERTFEVTSEGLRIRNRVDLKKLVQVGRSRERMRLDTMKARKEMQVKIKKKHDEEREGEITHARKRADIAKKKVAYAMKKRIQFTENREEAWRKKKEQEERERQERRKRKEMEKEEQERAMMEAEEELTRSYLIENVVKIAEKEEEDKKDDDDIEKILAEAGRGRKKKKKADDHDRPWSKRGGSGGAKRKKKKKKAEGGST